MDDEKNKPAAKSSIVSTIIYFIVATLAAGIVGVGYSMALKPASRKEPVQNVNLIATSKAVELPKKATAKKRVVHQLKPIIVNLQVPSDVWIRLDAAVLLVEEKDENHQVLVGLVTQDILAYLRTLSLNDIEGPIGLMNLRRDLNRRIQIRGKEKVEKLFILAMVVQ